MNGNRPDNYLDFAEMTYLTPENSHFFSTENGFLGMKAFLPPVKDDLEKDEPGEPVWQEFPRVFLHRAFPFDAPDEFISVLDKERREYGIIRALSEFSGQPEERNPIICDGP